ncbi:hypothetical protein B7P43_G11343 [Cryptotermes secundus]|nr:hypothetical protein B7P43_G11343 [Cryptotermes secundus]
MEESGMNTFLAASIMNKEKNEQDIQGDASENCAVGEKFNKISEAETLNMAMLSKEKHNIADDQKDKEPPSISDKYLTSPQILAVGTVPYPERRAEIIDSVSDSKANASFTDTNNSGNQKQEGFVSGESKTPAVPDVADVSTSNSIIKTPSHLSEPKLNDNMQLLNEAAISAKDISVVAKPMTRDLKSVSAVQQVHENNERNETKDT